jgi:hypothetical protein
MSDGQRRLVLVVGVGRSGTSLMAGILGQIGFHIPQPEVQADDTNPRGFGEPRWVVDFHQRLMYGKRVIVFDARPKAWSAARAAAEQDGVAGELRDWLAGEFAQSDSVVVKDPRVGWFLPLWREAARELAVPTSFVTMLRHPAEILISAKRSYGTWQSDASRAAAWINVMLETERATRGDDRAFVRYPDLLTGWGEQVARLGRTLDLPPLAGFDPAAHPEVDDFVDPSLYRSRQSWDDLAVPARVRDLAEEVWAQLLLLADGDAGKGEASERLDAARVAYDDLYGEAEAIAQPSITAVRPRKKKPAAASAAPRPDGFRARVARRVPLPAKRGVRRAMRTLGRAR